MRWLAKAALQRGLGVLPQGERLNHFLQRHVTRSLPTGDAGCATIVAQAREHVRTIARHSRRAIADAVFYEFGADFVDRCAAAGFATRLVKHARNPALVTFISMRTG